MNYKKESDIIMGEVINIEKISDDRNKLKRFRKIFPLLNMSISFISFLGYYFGMYIILSYYTHNYDGHKIIIVLSILYAIAIFWYLTVLEENKK